MSETEALEVLSYFAENCATYFAMYISITFAYLSLAYFVGAALSRFQCAAISGLYIVSVLVTGATTIGWADAWLTLKAREQTMLDEVWLFDKPGIFQGFVILLSGIALVSLYFMYDVRRSGKMKAPPNKAIEADA